MEDFNKYTSHINYSLIVDFVRQGEIYDRMISMYSLTPEERYLEILNRCPDLLKLITLKELASYLMIRPETLSRIRKKVVEK